MADDFPSQDEHTRRSAANDGPPPSEPVPSRRQYLDLKERNPDGILLYRLGDFYETFDDDARIVARDVRITLTTRSFGRSGRVPMAGIPHHALPHYLGRLLAAGHTVAIAEQVGHVGPSGRGLVERAVTRVVTPGTVAEPSLLPAAENRYLAAALPLRDRLGLAWVDVSTGEFAVSEPDGAPDFWLAEELARLNPAEWLVPDGDDDPRLAVPAPGLRRRFDRVHFEPRRAEIALCRQFQTDSLARFGCEHLPAAIGAAGAIHAYLARANPALLPLLTGLRTETAAGRVGLDPMTRRCLELTRSLKTGGSRGSLLGVFDGAQTAQGARALRRLLGQPLGDLPELRRRQGIVAALVQRPGIRSELALALPAVGDLERLGGRVAQGVATSRDFLQLGASLRTIPRITEQMTATGSEALIRFAAAIDPCPEVLDRVDRAVAEGEDGGAELRRGFCPSLDAARDGARANRIWLARLEGSERERTGIRSLKVGFNKVFGYYIEVTKPNLALVPAEYLRKQTVATGERFVTAPLKEAEARSLAADAEIAELERAALARLGIEITAAIDGLRSAAEQLASLDALLALAEVAARAGWVAPELDEGDGLRIVGGRHPVVEAGLAGEPFIANDCRLGGDDPHLLLVTGPNMGGKSTFLRQVALIVVLAQVGSFVPASSARIGLVDRVFSRVGAQDDLAGGHSTFMVEMVETAAILHQATSRSLIILDEVGRGTSTADGLAIARAVLEDLHDRVGARTLFATHYLELAALVDTLPSVANVHVAALETGGRVIFLYAVRPGPADRAYGIHVARLAGLPPAVTDRAEALLTDSVACSRVGNPTAAPTPLPLDAARVAEAAAPPYQLALNGFATGPSGADRLARELGELDLATLTPREAIDWLFEQQDRFGIGS